MIKNLKLFVVLFCYVFAFYVGGISVSLWIAVPLYLKACLKRDFAKEIILVLSTRLLKRVFKCWLVLVFLAFLYPVMFMTYDYSFFRVIGMQGVHFIAALPVLAYIRHNGFTQEKIEMCFISIFVVQTFIQLIVLNSEFLSAAILPFNRFEPDGLSGMGSDIRGKALSAATTYHLSLAYGVCFIIYLKRLLSVDASLKNLCVGLLIFVGIFFAGRSGFVACLIGFVGYLLYNKGYTVGHKLKVCLKIVLLLTLIIVFLLAVLSVYSADFYNLLMDKVLPYAFEFAYSMDKTGSMETASTNQLAEMWKGDFNPLELVWGSGWYSNPDGSYYMHVDPGVLRHLLFMGVFGYAALIIYQMALFPFWKMHGKTKFYSALILLFILSLDFKGCTIGTNKFILVITLLLSFTYLYLPKSSISKQTE